MDNLTWFKFSPAQWFMGKIQRCDEITQARFIRLCCLYFNKEGQLSVEDAEIEIDADRLKILIDKKIVKVSGDAIIIEFLDNQFESITESTKGKSTAGTIGNLKRWYPDIYERFISKELTLDQAIAEQSQTDRTPIADRSQTVAGDRREEKSRVEEIREEKKREEEIIPSTKVEGVKPKKPKEPLHAPLKQLFLDTYEQHFHRPFYWNVKDSVALNKIIKQIRFMQQGVSDEGIADNFTALLTAILNNPHKNKWLYDNLSPSIIGSKFNEILNQFSHTETGGVDITDLFKDLPT